LVRASNPCRELVFVCVLVCLARERGAAGLGGPADAGCVSDRSESAKRSAGARAPGVGNRQSTRLAHGVSVRNGAPLAAVDRAGVSRHWKCTPIFHSAERDLQHADAVEFLSAVADALKPAGEGMGMANGRRVPSSGARGQVLVLASLVLFVLCLAV